MKSGHGIPEPSSSSANGQASLEPMSTSTAMFGEAAESRLPTLLKHEPRTHAPRVLEILDADVSLSAPLVINEATSRLRWGGRSSITTPVVATSCNKLRISGTSSLIVFSSPQVFSAYKGLWCQGCGKKCTLPHAWRLNKIIAGLASSVSSAVFVQSPELRWGNYSCVMQCHASVALQVGHSAMPCHIPAGRVQKACDKSAS